MVCMVAGGPQQYTGRSMRDSHKGMNITEEQWLAFCSDLKSSLEKFKVGEREMNELTNLISSLKSEIMGTSLYDRIGGKLKRFFHYSRCLWRSYRDRRLC